MNNSTFHYLLYSDGTILLYYNCLVEGRRCKEIYRGNGSQFLHGDRVMIDSRKTNGLIPKEKIIKYFMERHVEVFYDTRRRFLLFG